MPNSELPTGNLHDSGKKLPENGNAGDLFYLDTDDVFTSGTYICAEILDGKPQWALLIGTSPSIERQQLATLINRLARIVNEHICPQEGISVSEIVDIQEKATALSGSFEVNSNS